MNRLSQLVLAAALVASVPVAASADDCEHDRGPAPAGAWSSPAQYRAYPQAGAYPSQPEPSRPAPRRWREYRWRERELAEVNAQLLALDAERARFHAENGWRPGPTRKFERYYAARRAELERRWYELQTVAWR